MKFNEKKIILKNGSECLLRSPEPSDAAALLNYLKKTSSETCFMARYEEEVTMSVEDERNFLVAQLESKRSLMIGAFIDGKIVANTGISCVAPYAKYQHRAELGIAILKPYWNLGIGSVLLSEMITSAKDAGYAQLELEVVAENTRAITLYLKKGFIVYGTRERSFQYKDGSYGSEYMMLRKL